MEAASSPVYWSGLLHEADVLHLALVQSNAGRPLVFKITASCPSATASHPSARQTPPRLPAWRSRTPRTRCPRVALIYKPFDATTLHAGFARYFTPPYQAQAAQPDIAMFTNTTNQPEVPLNDPVKPERSSYYDVGVDQKVLPGLTLGLDAYYKNARDQIDDGQFGAAVVLTQFNYARGYSEGGEVKIKYNNGNFNVYANFSYNITRASTSSQINISLTPQTTTTSSPIGIIPMTCSA
jgi:outer membrane receptor protein involved in Fe transport